MPIACRRSESTIMIRVKEVIKITKVGMMARTVIITSICRDKPYSEPASFAVINVSAGPDSAPQAGMAKRAATAQRTVL